LDHSFSKVRKNRIIVRVLVMMDGMARGVVYLVTYLLFSKLSPVNCMFVSKSIETAVFRKKFGQPASSVYWTIS
jgi:hypothetical protein